MDPINIDISDEIGTAISLQIAQYAEANSHRLIAAIGQDAYTDIAQPYIAGLAAAAGIAAIRAYAKALQAVHLSLDDRA